MSKFRLAANPTFSSTVTIPSAGDQPAGEIKFVFKHKTKKELLDFYERSKGMSAVESCKEIAIGWDVQDENGQPVPIEDATIAALMENYHSAWPAISETYMLDLTKFKLGN